MAEIHPNDIGLAPFADVGDVEKLKTSAKNLVDALNEIYQNGTQGGSGGFGQQWYVDGENNIILGENNIVYGNNNFIIGSDNIIVGDNINIIANGKQKYNAMDIGYDNFDTETGKIYYYIYSDNQTDIPLKVGDKLVFSVSLNWTNSDWSDWVYTESPKKIVEILEVNTDERYIRVTTDVGISTDPPDEMHTVRDYQYISTFIPLIDEYKITAGSSSISFGGTSSGASSFTGCAGTAPGMYSFAVNSANAKGRYSSAFGTSSASGDYGFAACSSTAGGEKSVALNASQAYAPYSLADGYHVISAADNAVTFGKYGINEDACSIALANGTAIKTPGLAFKVLSDGSVHADKEYTSPCADYAEYFEWADGNPNNEDRAGYFVKLKDGKIVLCEDFDTPLGIVSATPAIIGDSGEMHWQGKYVTDDFGRIQYHDVTVPTEIDEDGNIVSEEHIETQPILNPNWNPEQEYIPRKDRPEWSAVGVLGKLIVYDDGTLQSGDICRCGDGGKAVKSIENGYTVLKRISDDKVLIWFKG